MNADGSRLANPRLDEEGNLLPHWVARGRFLDRRGMVLAETTAQGRQYTDQAQYIHLLGFETPDHRHIGLERMLNAPLSGRWSGEDAPGWLSELSEEARGYDVALTLDHTLQARAYQLLEDNDYTGCIVGIDPQSGEVLIAANRPTLDPASTAIDDWLRAYNDHPGDDMPPFCYRRVYAPGSTMKTLIAAAALETHTLTTKDKLVCHGSYCAPGGGFPIHDHEYQLNAAFAGHGACTLHQALIPSCNSIFAEVGVRLGWHKLAAFAEQAGFNQPMALLPDAFYTGHRSWCEMTPSELLARGRSPQDLRRAERSPAYLALTAIGQHDVRMTPLHLALWTAAIANGGRLMAPSLVKALVDQHGHVVWHHQPTVVSQVISEETARQIAAMMEDVVRRGTGRTARIAGVRVAGKTGTPQENAGKALFIAFAPVEHPRIALAVVVENPHGGGASVGPLVAELLKAACDKQ